MLHCSPLLWPERSQSVVIRDQTVIVLLPGVQSHTAATVALWLCGSVWLQQNIDTTLAGWGELQGFTDLMGSPLSSLHASLTTPPTPTWSFVAPSLSCSAPLNVFFRLLFLCEIRAWHYENNLIKQRLDHPFHAWYQSCGPVWFLAMIMDIQNIYRLRQTKILLSRDRLSDPRPPPPSAWSVSYRLNISLGCMLYTPPHHTTPHHTTSTTTTASSCLAAALPGKPGVRTSN